MKSQEMSKEELIKYLEMLRDCCRGNLERTAKAERWHYAGMGDFLLQHGQWFETPTQLPHWQGMLKACFHNAKIAAKRYKWKYVEGMANYIIPVHHAWCIDDMGNVQEVTWRSPGNLYFGVVLGKPPKEPLFDNMNDVSIFKKPFKEAKK